MSAATIPAVKPRTFNEIETIVTVAINEFDPAYIREPMPFPIVKFCDLFLPTKRGIEFGVTAMPPEVEGHFLGDAIEIPEHVYEGALRGDGRPRFTLAHEAAHALLHQSQLESINHTRRAAVRMYRKGELRAFEDPEWQANAGAAALLMPRHAVKVLLDRVPNRWNWVREIERTFHVSRKAAEIRLKILGRRGLT